MPATSCSHRGPLRLAGDNLLIAVRLQPAGGANRIDGLARSADGAIRLQARVTAAAEGGKANRALLKLLAKTWRLPAGDLAIVVGATSRNKIVRLDRPTPKLKAWLARWFESLAEGRSG